MGGRGWRLGVDARRVSIWAVLSVTLSYGDFRSIRAVLGVILRFGGWVSMSGTWMAWHGDKGVVIRYEVVCTCMP